MVRCSAGAGVACRTQLVSTSRTMITAARAAARSTGPHGTRIEPTNMSPAPQRASSQWSRWYIAFRPSSGPRSASGGPRSSGDRAPPSGGGSASSNLAGGAIRNRRLTCGFTFRLVGGQVDPTGVWQQDNRIVSVGNSSGGLEVSERALSSRAGSRPCRRTPGCCAGRCRPRRRTPRPRRGALPTSRVHGPAHARPWDIYSRYVSDPDRNLWEII